MSVREVGVLTTMAACAGAGAFIDFYIGKEGQKRVKDWLETWWYRLSDIPVRALGREEALNALRAVDYLFGPKLVSWKRLRSAIIFKLVSLSIFPIFYIILAQIKNLNFEVIGTDGLQILYETFIICLSLSIIRGLIALTIFVLRENYFVNLFIAVMLIIAQLLFFVYIGPLMIATVVVALDISRTVLFSYYYTSNFAYVFMALSKLF
jgi:hypothetical protein